MPTRQYRPKTPAARIITMLLMTALAVLSGCAGPKKIGPQQDDLFGARAYKHFLDGDIPRAIEVYKRAYEAARKIDNGAGAARHLSNIGRAYYELLRADSAALYFAKAYEEFKVYGNDAGILKSAAFLALCNASAGDNASAQRWLGAASSANSDKKTRKDNERYLSVIKGMVDFRLTSKVSNERELSDALAFYKKKKDHTVLSTVYRLMADVEFTKGNCSTAVRYLDYALLSIDESKEKYKRSAVLLKLAAIKFCAGDEAAGKHYYERAAGCAPKGAPAPVMEQVRSCGGVCR
ncbi:MAG: tetratricopeptide repeat protein [Chitinispirillia bacterium]|nr:tetratricopeptide repeat protein [Chitinispirillia bacterium]MCL2241915.1 tetratricopeptide repeat protein [Chitinispirillia bacterium]